MSIVGGQPIEATSPSEQANGRDQLAACEGVSVVAEPRL